MLISASGTIGKAVIFNGEPSYYQDSNIVWLARDGNEVLNKYLYYFYSTNPWKIEQGGTIQRLYNRIIEQTKIPIPPMEIQNEIVKILDAFTKLEAELKARRRQYEFYRNSLLDFGSPKSPGGGQSLKC
ncbi:restriction endonuclease subunit S [Campylobacter sp. faydin G-24]|uniref:Restriction endonuclease subunit S n=1 Tax=Campylobacter anatolicus TaxID=2829105 RepID=A0ABS5HKD2_9BACT|nr:restriction endonuclease subunit S [Campylobacter anatolicus]